MLPKTVLMVAGSGQPLDDVRRAISFCEGHGCHLAVTVVGIALPPPTSIYGLIPAETWVQEREEGQKAVNAQIEKIEEALADSGISGDVGSYFCDRSQVAGLVGTRARYADLALVQNSAGMETDLFNQALKGYLFESARPFLVVPKGKAPTLKPRTVTVAWNASLEAARAVNAALDMLAAAGSVRIAMVDPVASQYIQGEEPGGDIAAYLARHGAKVTVDVLSAAGKDPADAILQHAADAGADLIVSGAYGHSRLREYMFGGTTRELLRNDRIAVFMAH
jgi:nucleotide-binding universal stress UspA family protein